MKLFQRFLNLLPVKRRKIVFANFFGRGWGDNPKYIAAELMRQNAGYELVWLVSDRRKVILPKGIRTVKLYSRWGRIELATAGVIVNNVKNAFPLQKKANQYYIQTWHGDFPLKYIEKEAESELSQQYLEETQADSKQTDLLLSGSEFFSDIVRKSFWYDGEIMEVGLPRNDLFFDAQSEIPRQIRSRLGLPEDMPLVLYAPTFRDHGEFFPFPDFESVLDGLKQQTGREWALLVRLHPNDQKRAEDIQYTERLLNGSFFSDTQELEKAADLLITDYSSMMYDFALQRKPVVLFTPDMEEYRAHCRGLRPLFDELPFIRTNTDEELKHALPQLFDAAHQQCVDVFFRQRIRYFDDGHASEKVVARINDVISLGRK